MPSMLESTYGFFYQMALNTEEIPVYYFLFFIKELWAAVSPC